ncbi:3-hydroxyacyl-ACP dehydratase FabZ [Candidatus Bipolaricaulota bacterium]|nr:3-hydroxyacyl-ACP dehydratase FabZ [Candidatus Bipolaricaulota bacterium]TFH10444.1 MAG: 3-hydroxyacyl-ACP dehydratase FabZ [Candidatus Atribacteria bacterium]
MYDIEAIRQRLPHRYPFLLVDRIIERSAERVVGIKNVTANEPFFLGHFPLEAVMPGVLILEAMTQTAAFLALDDQAETPSIGYLVGIDKAKFRRKVVPGDQLRMEARISRQKRELLQATVEATVDGELAASAVVSMVLRSAADDAKGMD